MVKKPAPAPKSLKASPQLQAQALADAAKKEGHLKLAELYLALSEATDLGEGDVHWPRFVVDALRKNPDAVEVVAEGILRMLGRAVPSVAAIKDEFARKIREIQDSESLASAKFYAGKEAELTRLRGDLASTKAKLAALTAQNAELSGQAAAATSGHKALSSMVKRLTSASGERDEIGTLRRLLDEERKKNAEMNSELNVALELATRPHEASATQQGAPRREPVAIVEEELARLEKGPGLRAEPRLDAEAKLAAAASKLRLVADTLAQYGDAAASASLGSAVGILESRQARAVSWRQAAVKAPARSKAQYEAVADYASDEECARVAEAADRAFSKLAAALPPHHSFRSMKWGEAAYNALRCGILRLAEKSSDAREKVRGLGSVNGARILSSNEYAQAALATAGAQALNQMGEFPVEEVFRRASLAMLSGNNSKAEAGVRAVALALEEALEKPAVEGAFRELEEACAAVLGDPCLAV